MKREKSLCNSCSNREEQPEQSSVPAEEYINATNGRKEYVNNLSEYAECEKALKDFFNKVKNIGQNIPYSLTTSEATEFAMFYAQLKLKAQSGQGKDKKPSFADFIHVMHDLMFLDNLDEETKIDYINEWYILFKEQKHDTIQDFVNHQFPLSEVNSSTHDFWKRTVQSGVQKPSDVKQCNCAKLNQYYTQNGKTICAVCGGEFNMSNPTT